MSDLKPIVMESRACRNCGYELRGLRIGDNCPECGTLIRSRPKSFNAREGTITDADPQYVRLLAGGFWLMAAGILIPIGAIVLGVLLSWFGGPSLLVGTAGSVVGAVCWCSGSFIISRPRPVVFAERDDPVLDSAKFRLMVRISGSIWIVSVVLNAAHSALASSGSMPLLEGFVLVLLIGVGLVSFVSLVPMCIFVSDMSFWMSDDSGGWRLRGAAWAMAIFGTLALVLTGMSAMGATWANLFLIWCWLIVFVAQAIFAWSVLGCARIASYTLRYQIEIEGRAERISERIRAKTEQRGAMIGHDMDCRGCGYNLRGLPNGGSCPECGMSYADITPPAPTASDELWDPSSVEAIDVEDHVVTQPIVARVPSIGPDAGRGPPGDRQLIPPVDNEAPIPLAGGPESDLDADRPEDLQVTGDAGVEPSDDGGAIPLVDEEPEPDDRSA
ncbi:MAG: MFS transporter [Planctomycetota bacterium]